MTQHEGTMLTPQYTFTITQGLSGPILTSAPLDGIIRPNSYIVELTRGGGDRLRQLVEFEIASGLKDASGLCHLIHEEFGKYVITHNSVELLPTLPFIDYHYN